MASKEKYFFISFAILILVIYGQSLSGGFVFDDRGILEHRQELFNGIDKIFQAASYPYWTVEAGLYRPTSLVSYWMNSVFLGGSAFSFHLINLLLYFGICVLLFKLLKSLFKSEKLALFSSLIFLVLPIHTEVVANITGRLELLALLFSLLTLREVIKERPNFWFSALWMFLAIGSKETAIATVPLVGLIFLIRKQKLINPATLGVVFGAIIYFLLRFLVLGPEHFLGVETSIIENPLLFADVSGRVATALSILWMYISKTFWPVSLCSDYSYNQIPVTDFSDPRALLGALVLLAAVATFFVFLRRKPIISFASAIFLASFVPVSNLLFPVGTIAGERLFFFPSLGLTIVAAYLLSRKKILIYITGIIIVIFAIFSFTRQSVWMSEEKLFLNAAECSPNSVLSLSNLGTVYYFRGEYEKAREALEASKAIKPLYSKGLNNLGLVYWKQGKNKEAEQMYFESLKQKYPYPGALENLILLKLSQGDEAGALRWLRIMYPNVADSVLRNQF